MTWKKLFWTLKNDYPQLNQGVIYQLLGYLNKQSRTWLMDNWEVELTTSEAETWEILKQKLDQNYPMAYLFYTRYFNGHHFYVNEAVLIPRDETELLVAEAKSWLRQRPQSTVLDLCTGSGAIGLSLKLDCPKIKLTLSDLSEPALAVATKNAQLHHLKDLEILQGDFLNELIAGGKQFNAIVCNPPYIELNDPHLDPATIYEPAMALFTPEPNNGYYFYEEFLANGYKIIKPNEPFLLLFEFGFEQKEHIKELLLATRWLKNSKVTFYRDWAGHWRFFKIEGVLTNANQ